MRFFSPGRITVDDLSLAAGPDVPEAASWRRGSFRYNSFGELRRGGLAEVSIEGARVDLARLMALRPPSGEPGGTLQEAVGRLPRLVSLHDSQLFLEDKTVGVRSLQARVSEAATSATLVSARAVVDLPAPVSGADRLAAVSLSVEGQFLGNALKASPVRVAIEGREMFEAALEMADARDFRTFQGEARALDAATSRVLRLAGARFSDCVGGVLREARGTWRGLDSASPDGVVYETGADLSLRDGFARSPDGEIAFEGLEQDISLTAALGENFLARRLRFTARGLLGAVCLPGRTFRDVRSEVRLNVSPSQGDWRMLDSVVHLTLETQGAEARLSVDGRGLYDAAQGLLDARLDEFLLRVGSDIQLRGSGQGHWNRNRPGDPANRYELRVEGLGKGLTARGTFGAAAPSVEVETAGLRFAEVSATLAALGVAKAADYVRGEAQGRAGLRWTPGLGPALDLDLRVAGFRPTSPIAGRAWGAIDAAVSGHVQAGAQPGSWTFSALRIDAGDVLSTELTGQAAVSPEAMALTAECEASSGNLEHLEAFLGGLGLGLGGAGTFLGNLDARSRPDLASFDALGRLSLRQAVLQTESESLIAAYVDADLPGTVAWRHEIGAKERRVTVSLEPGGRADVEYLEAAGLPFNNLKALLAGGKIACRLPQPGIPAPILIDLDNVRGSLNGAIDFAVDGATTSPFDPSQANLRVSVITSDLGAVAACLVTPFSLPGIRASIDAGDDGPEIHLAEGAAVLRGLSVDGSARIDVELAEGLARFTFPETVVRCASATAGGAPVGGLLARFSADGSVVEWTLERGDLLGGTVSGSGRLALRPRPGVGSELRIESLAFEGIDLELASEAFAPRDTRLSGKVDGALQAVARDGRLEAFSFDVQAVDGPARLSRLRVVQIATMGGAGYSRSFVEEKVLGKRYKDLDMIPFDVARIEVRQVPRAEGDTDSPAEFRAMIHLVNPVLDYTIEPKLDSRSVLDYLREMQALKNAF
jgi:hypothetical protein